MGFEVFFKFQRPMLVGEGAIPNQFPGFEFTRVGGSAGIVFGQSSLQVGSRADIFLVRKIDTADDLDVPHWRSREGEPDDS
jgi:hypothetical protein